MKGPAILLAIAVLAGCQTTSDRADESRETPQAAVATALAPGAAILDIELPSLKRLDVFQYFGSAPFGPTKVFVDFLDQPFVLALEQQGSVFAVSVAEFPPGAVVPGRPDTSLKQGWINNRHSDGLLPIPAPKAVLKLPPAAIVHHSPFRRVSSQEHSEAPAHGCEVRDITLAIGEYIPQDRRWQLKAAAISTKEYFCRARPTE